MRHRYQLLGLIARGGMAEVHLARVTGEAGFSKLIALKRIPDALASQHNITAMLMDEARLTAQLSHPNIVQVFDFGRDDNGYFIAMEYVPGPDLASVLRVYRNLNERPPVAPMVDVLIQVLRGLEHAHRLKGPDGAPLAVIHRDISPGNVLLTPEGTAKVSDFGVARAAERLAEATRAGKTKGKVAYMSPEQARGKPLDARSDLFSVGLLLWEVLAGQRCYQQPEDAALLRQAAYAEVRPLKSVGVTVDPALDAIVTRATQADPARRFATAGEMAQELEAFHRSAYPRYTPADLGAAVSRVLGQLPPLAHIAHAGAEPPTDAQASEAGPLPAERPSRPSVRRPRAEFEESKSEREPLRPAAPVETGPTRAEQAAEPPAAAKGGGIFKLGAVVVAVALLVLGGLTLLNAHEDAPQPVVVKDLPPVPLTPPPAPPAAKAPPKDTSIEVRTPVDHPTGASDAKGGIGYLSVKCEPWCEVHVDGKLVAHKSPAEIPLRAGTHQVRLVNPMVNLEKRATVVIHADQTLSKYFNLVLK